MVNIDEVYDVEIEAIGDKGDGIAKIEGLAVIVQGSKTIGQQVQIKITNVREKFAFAEIVQDFGLNNESEEETKTEPKEDTEDFGEDPEAEEETSE